MKIGGADIAEDERRIEAVLAEIGADAQLAVDANGRFDLETAIARCRTACANISARSKSCRTPAGRRLRQRRA